MTVHPSESSITSQHTKVHTKFTLATIPAHTKQRTDASSDQQHHSHLINHSLYVEYETMSCW